MLALSLKLFMMLEFSVSKIRWISMPLRSWTGVESRCRIIIRFEKPSLMVSSLIFIYGEFLLLNPLCDGY